MVKTSRCINNSLLQNRLKRSKQIGMRAGFGHSLCTILYSLFVGLVERNAKDIGKTANKIGKIFHHVHV